MNGTPGSPSDRTRDRDARAQSDLVAIVILFGMVFLGAGVVILAGTMLVGGIQDTSQHEFAGDAADQTHHQIRQAMATQSPRNLPDDLGGVQQQVVDGGTVTLEMIDVDAGTACGERVEEEMGAIEHQTDAGRFVYEGGAIWEETDAGWTIARHPSISYDADSAQISLELVSSASNESLQGGTAMPDQDRQSQVQGNVSRLLTRCPAQGFTDLRITVESEYHELWKGHFDERIDTSPNVTVSHSPGSETVEAVIENATAAHPSRGLRFDSISADDYVGTGESFAPHVVVANDGFLAEDATVEFEIPAASHTETVPLEVAPGGTNATTFGSLSWSYLTGLGLDEGQLHDYTLRLYNDSGDVVSTTSGSFFLNASSPGVFLDSPTSDLRDGNATLVVNATLRNTHPSNVTEDVSFEITDGRVSMSPATEYGVEVPAGGTTTVTYEVNVSTLPGGTYDYEVWTANETESGTFTIPGTGSRLLGRIHVDQVTDSADVVSTDDSFGVTTQLSNNFAAGTTGDVTLDVEGLAPVTQGVSVPGDTTVNETLTVGPSDLQSLDVGEVHNYTVTVVEDNETLAFEGSFYLGQPGSAPRVADLTNETDGDVVTIDATIANDGVDAVADNVTLTLANDAGVELASGETREHELGPGESRVVTFEFNASELAGAYEYEIEYGGDTRVGTLEFGAIDDGGGEVTITAPGTGTVTVLGTEVSAEGWRNGAWRKYWSPITVSSIVDVDGNVTDRRFENTAATDTDAFHNASNLNTYDTQTATYSHNWTQVSGETATLTVRSTMWEPNRIRTDDYNHVNTRSEGRRTWMDYHPPAYVWDESDVVVDASAGDNPENVRVLLDGDEVPNVDAANGDQRSAAEVLNQGAADRVDDDGTLNLGPNEAIFLFELTDTDATWSEAPQDGDPDYNDVIVLVSFNPDDPDQDVDFTVADGNTLGITVEDPDEPQQSGQQSVGGVTTGTQPGSGSEPTPADPQNPDPGEPSEPDEIDVDVGTVVIG